MPGSIRVRLKVFAGIEQSTDTVRTGLFRIAQEALTNVARHSKASQVEVSIRLVDGVIRMEIKDDGQGFDNTGTSTGKRKTRLGLLGMRERVEMMGGVFQVESAPGEPTRAGWLRPPGLFQQVRSVVLSGRKGRPSERRWRWRRCNPEVICFRMAFPMVLKGAFGVPSSARWIILAGS